MKKSQKSTSQNNENQVGGVAMLAMPGVRANFFCIASPSSCKKLKPIPVTGLSSGIGKEGKLE